MKALQIVKYGEIKDSLAFNEVNKPTVQANDVLIEVKAAAINPIDKSIILGNLQGMLPIPLPSTSAYDVSGVVIEKGNEVTDFEIGDLVMYSPYFDGDGAWVMNGDLGIIVNIRTANDYKVAHVRWIDPALGTSDMATEVLLKIQVDKLK